jgi:hypothetical protein
MEHAERCVKQIEVLIKERPPGVFSLKIVNILMDAQNAAMNEMRRCKEEWDL